MDIESLLLSTKWTIIKSHMVKTAIRGSVNTDENLGSLWLTRRILFCLLFRVATISEYETIKIAWPTND